MNDSKGPRRNLTLLVVALIPLLLAVCMTITRRGMRCLWHWDAWGGIESQSWGIDLRKKS